MNRFLSCFRWTLSPSGGRLKSTSQVPVKKARVEQRAMLSKGYPEHVLLNTRLDVRQYKSHVTFD